MSEQLNEWSYMNTKETRNAKNTIPVYIIWTVFHLKLLLKNGIQSKARFFFTYRIKVLSQRILELENTLDII